MRDKIVIELLIDYREDKHLKYETLLDVCKEAARNIIATAELLTDRGQKPEIALTTPHNFFSNKDFKKHELVED